MALDFIKRALGGVEVEPIAESNLDSESPEGFDDTTLLKLFKKCKQESFQHRDIWERQWMRAIHFINFRQWITYVRSHNEWRDIRMAKHIPRPISSKPKEALQALRSMFASVNIGVNVRPNGGDPKNIAVAALADNYGPILHEEHQMNQVLNEADYWFIVTGNVFIHTYFERDPKWGFTTIQPEQCQNCGNIYSEAEISNADNKCPDCGGLAFAPAADPATGAPLPPKREMNGRGVTAVLSPFELIFRNTYPRFSDVPFVIRLRWRVKDYFLSHPKLKAQFERAVWQTAPSEQAMQLFRSLPHYNDTGVAPFLSSNSAGAQDEEGLPEYELWHKPTDDYPDGLVMRVVGDSNPIVLHLEEEEAIPGPLPYKDADGLPLFTFAHAGFEPIGGRVYASGPIDTIIPRVIFLNQLDSMFQMITQRMSAPQWFIPKGSEIQQMTGEPGTVVYWNPLTVGGNAKPEMTTPPGPPASFFKMREMYHSDIEDAGGTFDIIKGAKPTGVEAFSALQLLVERSQGRFSTAFQQRGDLYKDWFKFALEIEREFGPTERTRALLTPAGTYTFKTFQNAQLQGSFNIVVEDGSNTPKTSLGTRASVQQLNELGAIDMNDPDQRYKVLQLFGQPGLAPSLDIHTQAAHRKQQAFEDWAANDQAKQQSVLQSEQAFVQYQQNLAAVQPPSPQFTQSGPDGQLSQTDPAADAQAFAVAIPQPPSINQFNPLAWKPWYEPTIHRQEFMKWVNSDRMQELLTEQPALEQLLVQHLTDIDASLAQKAAAAAAARGQALGRPGSGGGTGRALSNSNNESSKNTQPRGTGEGAQSAGPR